MDITFSCEKCGQSIVIDEAGAGISIDCPKCGKPTYVPSSLPHAAATAPVRIETRMARPLPVATPVSPAPNQTASSSGSPRRREDFHPAIFASIQCLMISGAILLIGAVVSRENLLLAPVFIYMAAPFITAAPLCAIYGMCVGHVKHGLLLLGAMSLCSGISYWVFLKVWMSIVGVQLEQFYRQFPQLPH